MSRNVRTVVVPGNHDGVHAGHRALIEEARQQANAERRVTALTFDPHPLAIVAPERAPAAITTIPRRIELLREAGADDVVVQRFDSAYAKQSPESFVHDVLVTQLQASVVVVGPDFRFGAGRHGTIERLSELGAEQDFRVVKMEPLIRDGQRVSSTKVREAISEGRIADTTTMLGRPHELDGTVVLGHQRGRTIGFPTANLDPDPVLLPSDGVYAVIARVIHPSRGETQLGGVANLGVRPTLAAGRSVEVHLFDFDGDLYGKRLRVGFVARLRGERKFDDLDALKAQIAVDAYEARNILETQREPSWNSI